MLSYVLSYPKAATKGPVERVSDEELARRSQQGNNDAYALLVERYQRSIVNLVYRLVGDWQTALDLSQDVFLRVYQSLDHYDPQRPFKPWLYRVATNLVYDHLRRQQRRHRILDTVQTTPDLVDEHLTDPEELALQGDIRRAVEEVIAALPPHYRTVVVLRYLEDMSYREIATALDMPIGTVKTHIHRARELMRVALEAKGWTP